LDALKRKTVSRLTGFLQAGILLLLAGWKWGTVFPINKALWSSSYVLVTAGFAVLLFGACYGLIEVLGWKAWSKPFEIFGENALLAYILHVLFLKIQNLIQISQAGGPSVNLRIYLTNEIFGSWLSPENASLAYASCYVLVWLGFFWNFHRRKLFIKI